MDNKPLTLRQSQVLQFIKSFTDEKGYSPTVREIANHMHYESSSTAFCIIEKLIEKDCISKGNGPRTIRALKWTEPINRIYLASSWKNADKVKYIKGLLVSNGFEVDAFCDPSTDRFVFGFDLLPDISNMNAQTVLKEPIVQKAYKEDKRWLDWAGTVILILPSGKSAHLEAGYAAGAGKRLIIYQEEFPKGEFDVMYGFADLVSSEFQEIIRYLKESGE